jgi:hypothetical protein
VAKGIGITLYQVNPSIVKELCLEEFGRDSAHGMDPWMTKESAVYIFF